MSTPMETNTEELRAILQTVYDLPNAGSGPVQSDWNQNDATAADYVKNRPFWTDDPPANFLVEEVTNVWTAYEPVVVDPVTLVAGETYTVCFDGTEYECTAKSFPDSTIIFIGNISYAGAPDYGNGEPFGVYGDGTVTNICCEEGQHTISVYAGQKRAHGIDPKYLPTVCHVSPDCRPFVSYSADLTNLFNGIDIGTVGDSGEVTTSIPNNRWEFFKSLSKGGRHRWDEVAVDDISLLNNESATVLASRIRHAGSSSIMLDCIRIGLSYNAQTKVCTMTSESWLRAEFSANEIAG